MIENVGTLLSDAAEAVGTIPKIPKHEPILQHTSALGHRVFWVMAVLMLLSSLVFYVLAGRVLVQKRLFHVLVSLVTTISFLTYFALATGGGVLLIHRKVHHHHSDVPDTVVDIFRQLHWARWVNWGLTHPLILISLTLVSGVNGASLLVAVAADLIMWVSGFISVTYVCTGRKWAWFTIALLAYLTVVYQLGFNGRRATAGKDARVRKFYASLSGFSFVVLAIYPIVWAISPNAHRISVNAEIIIYAILDLLSQAVFGYWLIVSHDSMDVLTVSSDGFWAHGTGGEGLLRVGEPDA